MNKKYYIIGGIIVFLMLVGGLVLVFGQGPGNPNKKPPAGEVELTWWKTFETSDNIDELIRAYQEINPGVRVNYLKKDAADYESEIINAIASGNAPDIISIHNDWLPKHIDKLTPAPESTAMNLRIYTESFVDVAYSDFVNNNQIYAVPLAMDTLALYYNKDILGTAGISLPPSTWPELVRDVEKITKVSRSGEFSLHGVSLGTSDNINRAVDILTLLMLQNGTKFYTDDLANATFDQQLENFNPGSLALTVYTQFASPAVKAYSWNVKSDFNVDAFTQGKLAMMFSYQYMQPVIRAKSPNLNWDIAPMPQISSDISKINFANYWGEAVTKASPNAAAAWDFLNFISSKDSLIKYYARHKLPSSRKDIIPSQIGDRDIGVFAEAGLTARSVYKKDANIYEGVFKKMIDDVILNNVNIEEALHNAVQQINLNLQKRT